MQSNGHKMRFSILFSLSVALILLVKTTDAAWTSTTRTVNGGRRSLVTRKESTFPTFLEHKALQRRSFSSRYFARNDNNNNENDDDWGTDDDDISQQTFLAPKSDEEVERDYVIPIFAIVSLAGLFGTYAYEIIRLWSRGELYLPWS